MSILRDRSNRLRLSGYAVLTASVAVVLTLGLLSIFRSASASSSVARTVTAQIGTVASSVSASGNVSPSQSESVNFETGGTLTAVDVAVGDAVKAGQVLAKIDPSDADAALHEAEDTLQAAETTLADAEAGGTAAQLDQNTARLTSSELQLTKDRELLSTDETALTAAENALSSDELLGCPASISGQSTSSSATTSGGSTSGGSSSGGSGSGGSGSGGTSGGQSANTTTTTVADAEPTATTGSASNVATSTVTLNATLEPGGLNTSYVFEYGTTDSYGLDTAAKAVSGTGSQTVTAQVSGLKPNPGYIFRIVASNSLGSSTGLGVAFITAQSSCVTEQQTVTTDQQTVQGDEGNISAQEQSIAASEAGNAPVSSTILQNESQVLQDQQTVKADQKAVDETTLIAPMSGTVTSVSGLVGSTVTGGGSSSSSTGGSSTASAGSTAATGSSGGTSSSSSGSSGSSSSFITVDDLASLQVVAGFAEADASSIAVGQGGTVTLAALPNTEVAGTVVAVSPTSTVVSNVVTYDVTIAMTGSPATVKDGMTANVSVIVKIARNVLELPNAAITTLGTTSTVQLVQGSTTVTRNVTIGLVGAAETQITSGLQSGDKVHEASATSTGATGASTAVGGAGLGGGGGFGGGGGLGGGGLGAG